MMTGREMVAENRRRKARLKRKAGKRAEIEMRGRISVSRCAEDFEYWAARTVVIRDKKTGRNVPFRLNAAQLEVLEIMEKMRLKGKPIRLILLKARQWGGSTLIQVYMAWIQLIHKKNWHSVICAHVKDSARNIRGMYSTLLENYPTSMTGGKEKIKLKGFEGAQNIKIIDRRECRVTIASAESQDSVRGSDIAMAHLSETAYWKATPSRDPEDFMRAVCSSIPLEPLTLVAIESTANGVGNFFHTEWQRATAGK